jgi:SAM-dependent methyltransferase
VTTNKIDITRQVQQFYNQYPFPGYEVGDYFSIAGLYDCATEYVKMLDKQIPPMTKILDVGCGTGQFAALLSVSNRYVLGIDLSERSIEIANELKRKLGLHNVKFQQADLFEIELPTNEFDFVFCNGVLHHTCNPYGGFQCLCRWCKPGGYIIVGLYNRYGRLLNRLRGIIFRNSERIIGPGIRLLDYFWRRPELPAAQKLSWYQDQYHNPHETSHTIDEVLCWFDRNGIEYVKAIPKVTLFSDMSQDEQLFEPETEHGSLLEHWLVQLSWILSGSKEGGYFVLIGRKQEAGP